MTKDEMIRQIRAAQARGRRARSIGSTKAPFKFTYWIFGDLGNSVGGEDQGPPLARRSHNGLGEAVLATDAGPGPGLDLSYGRMCLVDYRECGRQARGLEVLGQRRTRETWGTRADSDDCATCAKFRSLRSSICLRRPGVYARLIRAPAF